MRQRLAIVASHVIQYQDPLFRRIAAEQDIELTVLYGSRHGAEPFHDAEMGTTVAWDVAMLHGYRHRFFRNVAPRGADRFWRLVNPRLVAHLLKREYDAVIFMTGWGTFTSLAGMAACRLARVPFFIFGDSTFPPPESTALSRIRAGMLRALFGLASGFMISGSRNAEYYRHYGADDSRFFAMPWAIDNARFIEESRFAEGEREVLRQRHGIARDDVAILFSGKLVPRKDPLTLLAAFTAMRNRGTLVIAGDGELRTELERLANDRVRFLGFINQTELPKIYAMSDLLVVPSINEPWGLVINEAMACSLPVIASDRTGAAADLVRDGENGFVFRAGDREQLAAQLDLLAGDSELRRRMGERSRAIIEDFDYAADVRGIRRMLQFVGSQGGRL